MPSHNTQNPVNIQYNYTNAQSQEKLNNILDSASIIQDTLVKRRTHTIVKIQPKEILTSRTTTMVKLYF